MIRTARLTLALLPLAWGQIVMAQSAEEEALDAVREEIEALEDRVARQTTAREAGQRALRSAELAISASAAELVVIREGLALQRARSREVEAQIEVAGDRLGAERGALGEQVRMSYLTGRQEMLRLLLNQESPARLGRMMVYYDYLNRARSERVAAVTTELATLDRLEAESERATRELADLERAQTRELETLGRARDDRRRTIAEIEQDIRTSGDEIERLRSEEDRLTRLVAELEALLAGFPVDPGVSFDSIRGRLAWPIAGALVSDYGDRRAGGQLRWNGVLLGAAAGTPVRTVYHGRVAYADWLPGLGLLVVVDHGDGYMSLYGHNEAILKESGDWVTPGEVIAQVGDSGGQSRNALYFEIRRNGEPVDPRLWMSSRLSR